ncbi:TRAM domain-containing protein [Salinirubellus sp. GCM10025818]|uniref:TRAM domain-containing protein n=1 Tax=Salinirubellus TaxID=2162630 RepID=UPI0030D6118F
MVEIPDSLRSIFSTTVQEQDGTYVLEVPSREIDHDAVTAGETYRVAMLSSPTSEGRRDEASQGSTRSEAARQQGPPEPPVKEGEVREVTVETLGDQGDGIAKVERGYVVIVPDAQPGDEPTIEIDDVRQNVAFASVVEPDSRTL